MGNVPVMPLLLQAFGWLLLLSFASGLLLWHTLAYAASKALPPPETPKDPVLPQRRILDQSYRTHVHEAGHIIALWLDPYTQDVRGAVVFRNGSGFTGYMRNTPTVHTVVSATWYGTCADFGGLAAEIIIFGKTSARSSEADLQHARSRVETILACGPHLMDTTPWLDVWRTNGSSKSIGSLYRETPAPEVSLVLDKAYAHTKSLMRAHQDRIRAIAFAMKDGCGHISRAEIEVIMGPRPHI
jgi:ATP-dependent Zn protease